MNRLLLLVAMVLPHLVCDAGKVFMKQELAEIRDKGEQMGLLRSFTLEGQPFAEVRWMENGKVTLKYEGDMNTFKTDHIENFYFIAKSLLGKTGLIKVVDIKLTRVSSKIPGNTSPIDFKGITEVKDLNIQFRVALSLDKIKDKANKELVSELFNLGPNFMLFEVTGSPEDFEASLNRRNPDCYKLIDYASFKGTSSFLLEFKKEMNPIKWVIEKKKLGDVSKAERVFELIKSLS